MTPTDRAAELLRLHALAIGDGKRIVDGNDQVNFFKFCLQHAAAIVAEQGATITALQQQLADARLLARAALAGMIVESYTSEGKQFELRRYKSNKIAYFTPLDTDEHGLPILTDEVRDALRKAVGE